MSATPRTDDEEQWAEWNGNEFKAVHVAFARELETENAELLAALQAWVAGCGDEHFSTKDECRKLIERSGILIAKALGK